MLDISFSQLPKEWQECAERNAMFRNLSAVTPGVTLEVYVSNDGDLAIDYRAGRIRHGISISTKDGSARIHFHSKNGETVFDGNKPGQPPPETFDAVNAAMQEMKLAYDAYERRLAEEARYGTGIVGAIRKLLDRGRPAATSSPPDKTPRLR